MLFGTEAAALSGSSSVYGHSLETLEQTTVHHASLRPSLQHLRQMIVNAVLGFHPQPHNFSRHSKARRTDSDGLPVTGATRYASAAGYYGSSQVRFYAHYSFGHLGAVRVVGCRFGSSLVQRLPHIRVAAIPPPKRFNASIATWFAEPAR